MPTHDPTLPTRTTQRLLFIAAVVTALALGIAKTEKQRHSPPSYTQKPEHRFEGFVSIDGYSHRAAAMADRLRGKEPSPHTQLDRPAQHLHPTAVLVPFLTALLSLVVGSVPRAFQLLSLGAFAGQLALVVWLARCMARERDSTVLPSGLEPGLLAGTLLAGHCLSARSAGQLYLDPFCALAGLAALASAWNWARTGSVRWWSAMACVLLAGFFTKISFLPFLTAPMVAVVAVRRTWRGSGLWIAAGTALAALATAWLYMHMNAERASMAADMAHLANSWNLTRGQLLRFVMEMALLLQIAPVVLFLRRPHADALRRGSAPLNLTALALAALVLLATWSFYLPAVARLYAPVLALLAAVTAAWIATSPWRAPRVLVAVALYLLANAAISSAMLLGG